MGACCYNSMTIRDTKALCSIRYFPSLGLCLAEGARAEPCKDCSSIHLLLMAVITMQFVYNLGIN